MTDADRHQLLGAYPTPAVEVGTRVTCAVRGAVFILGLTTAPIPWPVGRPAGGGAAAPVVFGGLAEAVRRESVVAVAHWWGVGPAAVRRWRRALGVGAVTEGTARLAARAYADPDRRRKLSTAKAGRPRPPEVVAAVRRAHLGRQRSDETRRKMSEAKRGKPRAARRGWAPEEDALLGVLPDAEVARRTGRSIASVASRRRALGREPAGR